MGDSDQLLRADVAESPADEAEPLDITSARPGRFGVFKDLLALSEGIITLYVREYRKQDLVWKVENVQLPYVRAR
jgi:hypothetical protein